MPLYKIEQDQTVSQIKPAAFSKERELQNLFEDDGFLKAICPKLPYLNS